MVVVTGLGVVVVDLAVVVVGAAVVVRLVVVVGLVVAVVVVGAAVVVRLVVVVDLVDADIVGLAVVVVVTGSGRTTNLPALCSCTAFTSPLARWPFMCGNMVWLFFHFSVSTCSK